MNSAGWMSSVRQRPITITTPRGPGPAARPTNPQNWLPHTLAAPGRIWPSRGRRRSSTTPRRARSFTTVIDIVPTIYEAAGITPPRVVNGFHAGPDRWREHGSTRSPMRKLKIAGRRSSSTSWAAVAIYHDGWFADTFGPRTPWLAGLPRASGTGTRKMMSGSFTT